MKKSIYDIDDLHNFVYEAQEAGQIWRPQSWSDTMMYDGTQWSETDYQIAVEAGIDPLTINRIFPTVNLILGLQVVNRNNIIAKGRTKKDSDTAQTMTEAIQFVLDQCGGEFIIQKAYKDQIIGGIGYAYVGYSTDPREEKIRVAYRDWKEMWFDPFGDPWLDIGSCRYVFHSPWVDLEELKAVYPKHSKALDEYTEGDEWNKSHHSGVWYDEAQEVEDYKLRYGFHGLQRKRVRPVDMWYPEYKELTVALFDDGSCKEIDDAIPPNDIVNIIYNCKSINKAIIKKMRNTVFLGDLILYDEYSPYGHDKYPFVPFISYLDRFGFPFGVPRQLTGQQTEINKRRSMALALLKTRRVTVEEGVVQDADALQKIYEEANKPSGFIVVKNGRMNGIKIEENAQLAAPQMDILRDSEREIQQISGANAELHGYRQSASESGIAIRERMNQSATMVASLSENLRRSLKVMGTLVVDEVQNTWTDERIIRVTDKLTGADRFVEINKRLPDYNTGAVAIKNNITQGKFDLVITETPATDTVREQNMMLLIETMKKSPPEMAPYIFATAMELSNLPNKDVLLAKIHPMLKIDPTEEDLSPDEIRAKTIQMVEQQKQQAAMMAEYEQMVQQIALQKMNLENAKLEAEIGKINTTNVIGMEKVKVAKDKAKASAYKTGFDIQHQVNLDKQANQNKDKVNEQV